MKPIKFPQMNCIYGKDQPEYRPLFVFKTEDGQVWSCWSLTFLERIKLLFTGRMWIGCYTFNKPLQPQLPMIGNPFKPVGRGMFKRRKET